jgi:hypothetical protein
VPAFGDDGDLGVGRKPNHPLHESLPPPFKPWARRRAAHEDLGDLPRAGEVRNRGRNIGIANGLRVDAEVPSKVHVTFHGLADCDGDFIPASAWKHM